MRISDWSSDVCSSDLAAAAEIHGIPAAGRATGGGIERGRFGAGQRAAPRALRTAQADRRRRATGVADREVEQGRATGGGAARSEEHTSELQSLMRISYAVFCLKKKKRHKLTRTSNEPGTYRTEE